MFIDRRTLELLRSIVIQFLNALDDALGEPRTIPTRHERRVLAIQEREGASGG